MLVDKEVWLALARQAQHAVVEVLDPAAHGLAVAQFDLDGDLAVAERTQVERFLPGFARRRRLGTAARGQGRGHAVILGHFSSRCRVTLRGHGFTGCGKTLSGVQEVSGHDFKACPERSRRVP